MTQFFLSVHWKKKLSYFDLKRWVTWVEIKTCKLKKTFIVLVTSKLLLYKLHLKLFWKLFEFYIKPLKSVWEQFCINHLTHIAWNDRYICKWSIKPLPLIVCARLSPLRKVQFCSLSAPPMVPLVYYINSMALAYVWQHTHSSSWSGNWAQS